MNQQELKNVLDLHRKWLAGEANGQRANLSGANLSDANLSDAILSGAILSDANLSDANLSGANLSGADLSGAILSGAILSGAILRGASLSGADLSGADLSGAILSDAILRGAILRGAILRGADLRYANLSDAILRGAILSDVKEDFFKILSAAQSEVLGLYDALMKGKIDGSTYQGECACLVGTIANIRHENHTKLSIDVTPDSNRPAERWFFGIRKGDIPQSNPISEITATWMREFMSERQIKFPKYEIVAVAE